MRRALALAILAAGCLLGAGSAEGYVTSGRPWPDGVITYHNAAHDQAWALEQAVAAWNASGAHVRFVAAPASRAQVRIEHFPKVSCTINAEATVGYGHGARVWIFRRDERSPYCNSYVAAQALAHELGHVLGLGHETRGCAQMNPVGSLQGPSLCPQGHPWQWGCRLLMPDDVAGAVALYGGTARTESGAFQCDLYRGIRPSTGLAVAWTGAPQQVRITFRRPASVAVPALLLARRHGPEGFAPLATAGACATDPAGAPHYLWDAQPGGTEETLMTLAPGTYCLTVWAFDAFGRPSDAPATLWIKV